MIMVAKVTLIPLQLLSPVANLEQHLGGIVNNQKPRLRIT